MGRGYTHISTFNPNDSNTICDVTGFVVKRSQIKVRWDGVHCIAEAWHPRHPQDTPADIVAQKVYPDIRTQSEDTTEAEAITII